MDSNFITAVNAVRPKPDLLPQNLEVRIHIQYGGDSRSVTLTKRRTTFGRGDADIVTTDPTMSRKHFQVEVSRNGVVLHDLASANGTIHKGRWASFANLHEGDVFQAGNTRFKVSIRTASLTPARLVALVGLDTDEASVLAGILDGDLFSVRTVEPEQLLEACRMELPDLVILAGTPRDLTTLENIKRLPRLKASIAAVLVDDDPQAREHAKSVGADSILGRSAAGEVLDEIAERLVSQPPSRELSFPVSVRSDGIEAHGRLSSLSVLNATLKLRSDLSLPDGTELRARLLLPNEYGVVSVIGVWRNLDDGEGVLQFKAFESNGQLQVRRVLRDTPEQRHLRAATSA